MKKEEIISKCKEINTLYKELYGRGLVGVSDSYIHLDNNWFNKISKGKEVEKRTLPINKTELACNIDDLEFITLVED